MALCPRCRHLKWDRRTFCENCGLLAPGAHPGSPLARGAAKIEERWLRDDRHRALAQAFEGSPGWHNYIETRVYDLPTSAYPTASDAPPIVVLPKCTVLGGAAWTLAVNDRCALRFWKDRLEIALEDELIEVSAVHVTNLQLEGGTNVRGGGFIGGGFGLTGAAEGMLEAALINALTTRRRSFAVLRLQTDEHEAFFLHEGETPQDLRMRLSAFFTAIRRSASTAVNRRDQGDPATRLIELGKLVDAGLLTRAEFARLKEGLVGD